MSRSWDEDEDTFEAVTLAAASEAFAEYEAREIAARAPTVGGVAPRTVGPGAARVVAPREVPIATVGAASIVAWIEFARGADYFAMLGLTRDASEAAIERSSVLALAALASVGSPLAERARAMVSEAALVLGDPATRAAYARHIPSSPGYENPAVIFWLPGSGRSL